MGYTLYRLSREKEALPYFHRVLNLIPDGAQTKNFSPDCLRSTAAPWRGNTAKRTEKHGIVGQYLV